jgi:hypothetical protein
MSAASAQNPLDKVAKDAKSVSTNATKAATNSFDVSSISTEVVNSLTKNLRLTKDQKPAVTSLVNDLLNKKKDILPTAATNKKDYDAKMTSIRNLFPEKMKKLISADQMKLLTALILKSNTSSNVLSNILF